MLHPLLSATEYLAQSGVIASLLKQQREEAEGAGNSVRLADV